MDLSTVSLNLKPINKHPNTALYLSSKVQQYLEKWQHNRGERTVWGLQMGELLDLAPPTQTICKSLGLSNHADLQAQSRYSNCTCPGLSFLLVNDCFFPLVCKQLPRDQVATEQRKREPAPC